MAILHDDPIVDSCPTWRRDIDLDDVELADTVMFTWTDQSPDRGDIALVADGYATPAVEMWVPQTDGDIVRAGYLKLTCGSADRDSLYPTVLHWLRKRKGWCLPLDSPAELWVRAHLAAQRSPQSDPTANWWALTSPSRDVIGSDLSALTAHLELRYADERAMWDRIAELHIVAMSHIGERWRGLGYGQRLYRVCARELAGRRDAALISSGVQSDSAQALWRRLAGDAGYRQEMFDWAAEPRPVLDYRNLAS